MQQTERTDRYGFTVAKELPLREWLNHSTEDVGEYIFVVPDEENHEVRLYRSFQEPGEGGRLLTVVPHARFGFNPRQNPRGRRPGAFYLTGGEARSLLAFLDLFGREQGDPVFRLSWYGDNGKGLTEGSSLTEESLYLRYRTDGGKEREVLVNSTWRSNGQMMAKFD